MIELNITFVIQIVNFLIGLTIINHFIIKPLREIMAKRRSIFSGLEADANGMSTTANSKLVEYEARLQKTRLEIVNAREAMKEEASVKAHAIQNDASEQARQLRQAAQEARVKEGEAAYESLKGQTADFAKMVTTRLLS